MAKYTKYIIVAVVFGILLLALSLLNLGESTQSANTTLSKSEQNIRGYLNETFNGPPKELVKIWELFPEQYDEEMHRKYDKKLREYREANLKPYVSERMYASRGGYDFLRQAYSVGYQLKVQDITVEENKKTENSYTVTAQIDYAKEGNSSNTITLQGLMNTNEEGKINRVVYHNAQEIRVALGEHLSFIEWALRSSFNGPNEELKEILRGLHSGEEDKYAGRYQQYVDQYVRHYYNLNEQSIEDKSLRYLKRAYQNGYELETDKINVEKNEQEQYTYRFTVEVSYAKTETQDWKTVTLKGSITLPPEGRITEITYENEQELMSALN